MSPRVICRKCPTFFNVAETDMVTELCEKCRDEADPNPLPLSLSTGEAATYFEIEVTHTYQGKISRSDVGSDEEWRELIAAEEKGATGVFDALSHLITDGEPVFEDLDVRKRFKPVEIKPDPPVQETRLSV